MVFNVLFIFISTQICKAPWKSTRNKASKWSSPAYILGSWAWVSKSRTLVSYKRFKSPTLPSISNPLDLEEWTKPKTSTKWKTFWKNRTAWKMFWLLNQIFNNGNAQAKNTKSCVASKSRLRRWETIAGNQLPDAGPVWKTQTESYWRGMRVGVDTTSGWPAPKNKGAGVFWLKKIHPFLVSNWITMDIEVKVFVENHRKLT